LCVILRARRGFLQSLSEAGAEAPGARFIEVAELVAKEAVRPVGHQVGCHVEMRVALFIAGQINSESVVDGGAGFGPGCPVDRHGDKPDLDAAPVQFGQQLVEVEIEDRQGLEPRQMAVNGDAIRSARGAEIVLAAGRKRCFEGVVVGGPAPKPDAVRQAGEIERREAHLIEPVAKRR